MRSDFSSSRLVRLLAQRAPVDAPPPGMDFAERLSLWLNAFDAIGLQAAHQSTKTHTQAPQAPQAAPATASRRRPATPEALAQDVQRVRDALAHAIAQDPQPLPPLVLPSRNGGQRTPPPEAAAPEDGYARYHQRHLELQRQMEQMITPLRDHVRQAIGQASTEMRQLAALDVLFEQALARREQGLMPTTAHLMQRRFEQLRQAHAPTPDNAWQQEFAHEWRQVLLAEVELRLQPVTGLVEAHRKQWKQAS